MKFEIKHRFEGNILFSLETDSLKLCLQAAVKEKAYLSGADLVADLGQPNGWNAYTYYTQGEQRVQVGCRNFTIAKGREYWAKKDNRREVLAALDYAESIGKLRGWDKLATQKAAA